jgi:hypothetical protein
VTGPAGVSALVLAETVAGGLALLYLSPLWGEVKRGFFTLTTGILAALAFAAWGSARAGVVAGDVDGERAVTVALAVAVASGLATAAFLLRRPAVGRVLGYASVVLGVLLLGALAATGEAGFAVAALQLAAGAAFLGAVLDGLLLGHWYLTDRRLTRAPIFRSTTTLGVGVALEAAAIAIGGFGPTSSSQAFNPLLTSAGLASWIALGMVGTTGLVVGFVRVTLRGERPSAVQAATGFFYLAVITALTAEFAAKVRFLP